MVNFADAHLPFIPQDSALRAHPLKADDVRTLPAVGVDTRRLRSLSADYYNCISRLDTGIGQLLEALESSGRARDTVIIYLADHGPQFARGKCTCYELGVRIPLIVAWPGVFRHGIVCDELVSTVDLVPTILDATHLDPANKMPGRSLMSLLRGEKVDWREHVFCEWNHGHTCPQPSLLYPQRSVRDRRYKLILTLLNLDHNPVEELYTTQGLVETGTTEEEINQAPPTVRAAYSTWRRTPRVELYDLHNDPYEFTNLAEHAELAETRNRLLSVLEAWRLQTHDPFVITQKLAEFVKEDQKQAAAVINGFSERERNWQYPQYLYDTTHAN